MSDYSVGSTQAYESGSGTIAAPTMIHTWCIVIGALVILWLLGGVAFRSVRM